MQHAGPLCTDGCGDNTSPFDTQCHALKKIYLKPTSKYRTYLRWARSHSCACFRLYISICDQHQMTSSSDRIALFIDGANLHATAKTLGFDIDYKRLLKEFQSRGTLVRAFYYTAIIEDQEYSSIRPLIDWLDYNGYTVVTKATKEFIDASG